MKTLVVYFSAEKGKTTQLAEVMAKAAEADLFAIEPEIAYTEADLNYLNPLSRCNKEKIGGKEIAVKGYPEAFEQYERVLVGFPIWYGGAPNIVNFFCEKLNFQDKEVALFATSAMSGIGKSAEKLAPYVKGAKILDAKRFEGASQEEVAEWLQSLSN